MTRTRLTLDPSDWSSFRALAHRVLDQALDELALLDQRPVWRSTAPEVRRRLAREAVPENGVGESAAIQQVFDLIEPNLLGSRHPRFWGWVQGNGFPLAALAEFVASTLNAHLAGFNHAPAIVEERVLGWLAQLMGLRRRTSGVFCSSGSMANLLGLAVARHHLAPGRPAVYASAETHGWILKALNVLGLPAESWRRVPVDSEFKTNVAVLDRMLAEDRAAGWSPFCLIGTAGTVNTGSTDPLVQLAKLARRERIWFHVDGAFGALARLHPKLAPLVAGIELADSLAFDLHKWGSMPFACAVTLFRDSAAHRAAFASTPAYMAPATRGPLAGGVPFADRGIDLSRGFESLKVWVAFKAYGVRRFAGIIRQNVEDAREFARRVEAHPNFELLAPVPLNIVCFRFTYPGIDLDAFNQELLLRLQESGAAMISSTMINGRVALRLANVNHRSRPEDFQLLLETLESLAVEMLRETRTAAGGWGPRRRRSPSNGLNQK